MAAVAGFVGAGVDAAADDDDDDDGGGGAIVIWVFVILLRWV